MYSALRLSAFLASVAAIAAVAGSPASAHEIAYKEFYDELAKFDGRPNTDRLMLRSSLRTKDREELERVEMTILTADGPVPVQVDEDNAFVLPINPGWVDEGARIDLNQDPKDMEIRVQIGMKLPDPARFSYADIMAAFDQFDGVIEKEAGVFSFAVPSARTLRVHCGTGCVATLVSESGEQSISADERGRVNIPKDKKLRRENPTITLSQPARYTSISTKG